MKLKLRPYQKEIVAKVFSSLMRGHRRPCVVAPTGAGKTAVMAYMAGKAQDNSQTVWFLVHRRELKEQTIETFKKFEIPMKTIKVGLINTVSNKIKRGEVLEAPDLIVLDEAHHAVAKTWRRVVKAYPKAFVIGLTATPARLDGKPLGEIFDDLVIAPDTSQLIRDGYLSPYRMFVSELDLGHLSMRAGDFKQEEVEQQFIKNQVSGDVVKTYKELAEGRQGIYFCTTRNYSRKMAAEFNKAGIKAQHFDGNTPKSKREQIVRDFRNGKIQILTNVDLIGEGFDMPNVDVIGMLRPTASLTIYLQQVGRALRPKPNKVALLIDHVGNIRRHGLPSTKRTWSLDEKVKSEPVYSDDGMLTVRQCPRCYCAYRAELGSCPFCGAEYHSTRQEIENVKEIKMIELKEESMRQERKRLEAWAWTDEALEDAETVSDLYTIADLRGYKPGWAWYQARKRGWLR